jgi:cell shape-determining protein MreC
MTRGRRPSLNPKPSRQLENQRAFRKRRADHLAELEEKVARLEQENQRLRQKGKSRLEGQKEDEEDEEGMKVARELRGSRDTLESDWQSSQSVVCSKCQTNQVEKDQLVRGMRTSLQSVPISNAFVFSRVTHSWT